jgi:oligogalacturonide lyase
MKNFLLLLCLLFSLCSTKAQQLAFPGADGFGKYALGGRNGSVVHVTTLNDSGPGSFRDAVSRPNRTVVFDISGVIHLKNRISVASFMTIAGQTAPGAGIVIYGNGVSFSGSNDVIVRHLRFRGSVRMGKGVCTVSADNASDLLFDHCSIEWGRWDNLHIKESKNITLQYCLIGEGINPQMFGALLENPVNLTIHHCLWVNNQSRNPKAKAGIEIVNNILYNWGSNGLVGGHSATVHHQDIINNYFIGGPNSSNAFIGMFTETDHVFHSGNFVDLDKNGLLDGRSVLTEDFVKAKATLENAPQNSSFSLLGIESATEAYETVLKEAGASLQRDAIDNRLIADVQSLGKTGRIIKDEAEMGGQPELKKTKALKDTDRDGMPDIWEEAHHLNPKNALDGQIIGTNGYSNLEVYLYSLVGPPEGLPVLQTGGQRMPTTWIDKDTNHKIIRLTQREANSASFYFHNNPFVTEPEGTRMVFYGNDKYQGDGTGMQLFTVNLSDFNITQLTEKSSRKDGEIVGRVNHNVYYQVKDSVYSINIDSRKTELVFVFPEDFKGGISTLNADESLLGGVCSNESEKSILQANPQKSDYFNKIYEAKLPRTLFTIHLKTKELTKLFTDSAWLNHVQFSTTDPRLLMFCHEGPWHKVNRIWTIDIDSKEVKLRHERSMDMEIAGHEWFSPDGKTLWFDLQMPRGKTFFVCGTDLKTDLETKFQLERNQWSVHYTQSPDQTVFAGDGGDSTSVAKAPDGKWINLFLPSADRFNFERLVNMKYHQYKLEPNVHFSPDGKWIIFRANFEGFDSVYAVEIKTDIASNVK